MKFGLWLITDGLRMIALTICNRYVCSKHAKLVCIPDLELQIMIINFDRNGTINFVGHYYDSWVPTGHYTNIGKI